jgi:signal transduction histidine kinase
VLAALVVLSMVPAAGQTLTAAVFVGCLFALAGVGRQCEDRTSVPAVVATVGVLVVVAAFALRPWDVVVVLLGCGAAWGAGRMLRGEVQRNIELRSQAEHLMRHREILAVQAVQAERIRIARELHDAVAHTVSVMTLQVGGVRRQLDTDAHRTRERAVLLDVEKLGREAVAELHRTLGVLRSPEEDAAGTEPGVGPAPQAPQPRLADLPQLAARVSAAGAPVEVRVEGSPRPLPAGLELAAYRVVQEALTNVLKHGGGATARVALTYSDDDIVVQIEDDGPAQADAADAGPPGHGLAGMRERVALYGGRFEAGPLPGCGFAVRATLPLLAAPAS